MGSWHCSLHRVRFNGRLVSDHFSASCAYLSNLYTSSGYLLWKIYLGLDSFEFPLTNYGDLAFRLYGTVPRYLVNTLQSIQLICSVGLIVGMNDSAP